MTAALPLLLPLVKRLIRVAPNDFFYAVFRAWYLVSHITDIMPRRLDWKLMKEAIRSGFGIYSGNDPNEYDMPEPEVPRAAA